MGQLLRGGSPAITDCYSHLEISTTNQMDEKSTFAPFEPAKDAEVQARRLSKRARLPR